MKIDLYVTDQGVEWGLEVDETSIADGVDAVEFCMEHDLPIPEEYKPFVLAAVRAWRDGNKALVNKHRDAEQWKSVLSTMAVYRRHAGLTVDQAAIVAKHTHEFPYSVDQVKKRWKQKETRNIDREATNAWGGNVEHLKERARCILDELGVPHNVKPEVPTP